MTEQDIQNSIRTRLSEFGIIFRTNAGVAWQGQRVYSKEFHCDALINLRKVDGLPAGFSDLLFCGYDGQAGFIEVKKPRGAIRPEQTNFINLMQSYGYPAGIARSAEDALKIIGKE